MLSNYDRLKGGRCMRNLRGFLWAAVFLILAQILKWLGVTYGDMLFMAYPYFSRNVMSVLQIFSSWTSTNVWQLTILLVAVAALVSLALTIVFRRNVLRWLGTVATVCSVVYFLHMGVYALGENARPLAQEMKLETVTISQSDLVEATTYYRDQANALANRVPRDSDGALRFDDFDILAVQAADGFESLTLRYSLFSGSTAPVKKLGFSNLFSQLGISGVTVGLTGEACVNPDIFCGMLPFTMCHEMAHRMAIVREDDANFAAYLACESNSDLQFQYSGYLNAYIYCINALWETNPESASRIQGGVSEALARDLVDNNQKVRQYENSPARAIGENTNNAYIQAMGDDRGTESYDEVYQLLVNWYLVNYDPDRDIEEEPKFDPYNPSEFTGTEVPAPATEPDDE